MSKAYVTRDSIRAATWRINKIMTRFEGPPKFDAPHIEDSLNVARRYVDIRY